MSESKDNIATIYLGSWAPDRYHLKKWKATKFSGPIITLEADSTLFIEADCVEPVIGGSDHIVVEWNTSTNEIKEIENIWLESRCE